MRIVPALDRGMRLLNLLARRGEAMTASEIAAALDVPRSATYEIISTLAHHRAVSVRDDGRIAPGPQLFVLGGAFAAGLDLDAVAQPVATEVMGQCQETVQVGVLDHLDVLYLAKADSPQAIRLVSRVGSRLPAHCTALGKVLLAYLPEPELAARMEGAVLVGLTDRSITEPETLRSELVRARESGSAWEEGESNPEVMCVAAPVRDARGVVSAAMSMSAPRSRMESEARRRECEELVVAGARRLSERLGYTV